MHTDKVPIQKNEIYHIYIDDLGQAGEGIGKINGFTVFVAGGIPGDKLEIKIVKVKKTFGYGIIVNILEKSQHRTIPKCPYADKCGGCQLQHLRYEAQLDFKTKKVKDCLERIGHLDNIEVKKTIGMELPYYYRNKAQFPVAEEKGEIKIGFYTARSHRIIDIEQCLIQKEVNDQILSVMRHYIKQYGIPAYDEATGKGLIRHILTRIGFSSGEIMACIVAKGAKLPHSEELIENLKKIKGMSSIVLNINRERTNVILGNKNKLLWGKDYISDKIGDLTFQISPLSFYQVNPIQTKIIYELALEAAALQGNETVLDLYCGIGTISLFFAQKAKKVIGVEIVSEAVEDAKRNAAFNDITNVEFLAGKTEEVVPLLYEQGIYADVIILDPPRKGCDKSVIETIFQSNPKKIVYISCDPATLARDLKIFSDNGYRVNLIQPIDQFCHTVHVETCVLLSHKNS